MKQKEDWKQLHPDTCPKCGNRGKIRRYRDGERATFHGGAVEMGFTVYKTSCHYHESEVKEKS